MIVPYEDSLGRTRSIGELLGEFEASEFAHLRFERARKKRVDHSASLDDDNFEYLFLGRNGMPYYLHIEDPLSSARRSPRRGESFKQSIALHLNPKVRASAEKAGCFELAEAGIGFHDFRGTFAEQTLLKTIELCQQSGMDRTQAEEVAVRQTQRLLGHSSIESTYRYLRFRDEHVQLVDANEKYAQSLGRGGH
jgi:integrase